MGGERNQVMIPPNPPWKGGSKSEPVHNSLRPAINEKLVEKLFLEKEFIFPTLTGGKDMSRFFVDDIGKRIIYTNKNDNPDSIKNIINYLKQFKNEITCVEVKDNKHPFWALHRARNKSIFQKSQKIIGVVTGDRIVVALDNKQLFPTDGLYVMSSKGKYSNEFLVGILNSRLATYFYRLMSMEVDRTLDIFGNYNPLAVRL